MALIFQPGGKHLSRHILLVASIGAGLSFGGVYLAGRWVLSPRAPAKDSSSRP